MFDEAIKKLPMLKEDTDSIIKIVDFIHKKKSEIRLSWLGCS